MKTTQISAKRNNLDSVKSYVAAMQHVTPHANGWQVKKSNADRATKVFRNQSEAIEHARKIAQHQQTELFIHGRNGQIRERNSY